MKKLTKVLSVIMISIMVITCITTTFAATSMDPADWEDSKKVGKGDAIDTGSIKNFSASLINVVSTVGSAAAIITLIILGIKYMMGSAEEKAEYKKTLLPYIIGAAMVFGASLLTGVIYSFMNNTTGA